MQRFVENYDASKKNYKCNATFLIFFSTIIVYSFDKYQIRGLLKSEKKWVGGGGLILPIRSKGGIKITTWI